MAQSFSVGDTVSCNGYAMEGEQYWQTGVIILVAVPGRSYQVRVPSGNEFYCSAEWTRPAAASPKSRFSAAKPTRPSNLPFRPNRPTTWHGSTPSRKLWAHRRPARTDAVRVQWAVIYCSAISWCEEVLIPVWRAADRAHWRCGWINRYPCRMAGRSCSRIASNRCPIFCRQQWQHIIRIWYRSPRAAEQIDCVME